MRRRRSAFVWHAHHPDRAEMRTTSAFGSSASPRRMCDSRGSVRSPFGRAAKRLAADRDHVGKLTGRREVFGNRLVIVGVVHQVGLAFARIKDDHLLLEHIANPVKRTDVIRVSADQHKGFCSVLECVKNHFGCKVDVRALFLKSINAKHAVSGLFACVASVEYRREPFLAVLVVTLNDADGRGCGEGLEIDVLPFNRLRIVRVGLDARREVFDRDYFMVTSHERFCEFLKVEPLQFGVEPQEPVIQIAAVDVYDRIHVVLDAKTPALASRGLAPLRQNLAVRCVSIIPYFPKTRNRVETDSLEPCRERRDAGSALPRETAGVFRMKGKRCAYE